MDTLLESANFFSSQDLREERRKRLTERLCIVFLIVCSGFGSFEALSGFYETSRYTFSFATGFIICYFLSRKNYHDAARFFFIIVINMNMLFTSLRLGWDSQIHAAYMCMIALPLILFSLEEVWKIIFGALLPVACFSIGRWSNIDLSYGRASYPVWYPVANWYVAFVVLFYIIYRFAKENQLSEKIILDQQQLLVTSSKFATMGEMAGGIAHEINNPLATIQLTAVKLRALITGDLKTSDPVQMGEIVDLTRKLESTVQRISKITNALYRIAHNLPEERNKPVNLRQILEPVWDLCRDRFVSQRVTLNMPSPDPQAEVLCSAVEISHVLLNLLNNAFDAVKDLPNGEVTVSVHMNLKEVIIEVIDNGPNIPEELQARLFQPFFTTKPAGGGIGLGLVVAQRLAQANKASLNFVTGAKQTTFQITLRRATV